MKSIFKIDGMHCNSCVLKIEKTLQSISGVNFVSVNLPLENVSIEYDDELSPVNFAEDLVDSHRRQWPELYEDENQ